MATRTQKAAMRKKAQDAKADKEHAKAHAEAQESVAKPAAPKPAKKAAKAKPAPKDKAATAPKAKKAAKPKAEGRAKAAAGAEDAPDFAALPEPKRKSIGERFWHALGLRAQKAEAKAHQREAEVEFLEEQAEAKRIADEQEAQRRHEAEERRKAAISARELKRAALEEEARIKREAIQARRDAKEQKAREAREAKEAKVRDAREAKEAKRQAALQAEADRVAAEQAAREQAVREAEEARMREEHEREVAEAAAVAEAEKAERARRKAEEEAREEAERAERAARKAAEKAAAEAEKAAAAARKAQEEAEAAALAAEKQAAARRGIDEEADDGEPARKPSGKTLAVDDDEEPVAPRARDTSEPKTDLDRHADKLAAELASRRSKPIVIEADEDAVPMLPVGRGAAKKEEPKEVLQLDPAPPHRIPDMAAPKGLSIPEHYILLALEGTWDERIEKAKAGALGGGLTGALLLELVLNGAVKVQRDRFVLDNADLDDATEAVARKLQQYDRLPSLQAMGELAKWLPQLLPAYKDRMMARGLIEHKQWRHLGLLYRSQTALLDQEAQERLRNKLARAIAGGGRPDAPTILSLGLLEASGLFGLVVPEGAQAYNRKRLNGLLAGKDTMGYKVDDQLKGIQEIAVRTILDNVRLMTVRG